MFGRRKPDRPPPPPPDPADELDLDLLPDLPESAPPAGAPKPASAFNNVWLTPTEQSDPAATRPLQADPAPPEAPIDSTSWAVPAEAFAWMPPDEGLRWPEPDEPSLREPEWPNQAQSAPAQSNATAWPAPETPTTPFMFGTWSATAEPPSAEAMPWGAPSEQPPAEAMPWPAPAEQPVTEAMPWEAPAEQPPSVAMPQALHPETRAEPARSAAESVIGPEDFFDGRYRSERGVRIQGTARGSIESRQHIFVEEGAQVEADLAAEDITIAGSFSGTIECRRRLEIAGTGVVQGRIQTALLVVQEGGALDGELRMRAAAPQDDQPPAETPDQDA